MRILMVTPYPPVRDGIAAYAVQAVAALRRQGHDVEVLSPGPTAAHHHLQTVGPRGALALAKRVRRYDKVVVQFHPDVFYPTPSTTGQRAAVSLSLAVAFRRAREVEVLVHEIDYRMGRSAGPDGPAARLLWRSVDRIVVHTAAERRDFTRAFGVSAANVAVAEHGAHFARHSSADRATARRSLGVPEGSRCFLAIGFIQPHKGFDRAVAAFAGLGGRGCRLDIVGSVRVEEPGFVAYLNELEVLAAATEGVTLHAGYVSDELFDRWIVAADVVVLPYRSIWSSGVLERAALYDRPVIATAVGGLPHQAAQRPAVTLVADDAALRTAVWAAAGERALVRQDERDRWATAGPELRATVQAQLRRRAAADRGTRVPVLTDRPGGLAPTEAAVAAAADGARSAPVRRLHPLELPPTTSGRSSAAVVKRAVRRLTAWQLEPVVRQVNALRAATVDALDRAGEAEPGEPTRHHGDVEPGPPGQRGETLTT